MLGNNFYDFKTIEKITAAFGWIFSDISLVRTDPANVNHKKTIKVPIDFASKEKWVIGMREDPDVGNEEKQRHVQVILPRLAYDLKSFRFDSRRKLSSVNYRVAPTVNGPTAFKQLNPIPMIFSYSLYLQTRTLEDGWAIAGQILPFFKPDYVVPIIDIPQMNLKRDIIFTLVSNTFNDSYEGNFLDKRVLEWQFDFEARGHLYQPIKEKKVIDESDINLYFLGGISTVSTSVLPKNGNIDAPFIFQISTSASASAPILPIYTYYIDPISGNDSNSGTSVSLAWLNTDQADNISLTSGQSIGYKLSDTTWVLYRTTDMTADMSSLPANLNSALANSF